MAIDRSEFTNKIEIGLKADKGYQRFFYRFKIDKKTFYQIFDYSEKDWDKRTRVSKAKSDAFNYKESKKDTSLNIDENIKLDTFINKHFETMNQSNSYSGDKWKGEIQSYYKRYIKKVIGNKKLKDVRQMHIKEIIKNVRDLGLKERTQKTTLEILNPIFKSAIANRLIIHNPCDGITIKRPKTKKRVDNASQQIKDIYNAILVTFKDEPYFQALYLFALQGRRKSEILTLKWEYIDIKNNSYTLPITKSGEKQTFFLPNNIANLLLSLKSNKKGYVFASPIEPKKYIQNIQGQTNKLKKALNNPSFGIHYLRNIVSTVMAEQGMNNTHISGALGHTDLNTANKYTTMPNEVGSKIADETIKQLTQE